MKLVQSHFKKFLFGANDREVDKDYTMDELVVANTNIVSGPSRQLEKSKEGVKFANYIKGANLKIGEEEDEVHNVVYAIPPLEDPWLMAKAKLEITKNETKLYFSH